MLTHIVIWKYFEGTGDEAREEHLALLRALANVVPGIQSLTAGFDVLRLARSYDIGLVGVFSDRAALEAYTVHPQHVAAVEFGRNICETVASVDFED